MPWIQIRFNLPRERVGLAEATLEALDALSVTLLDDADQPLLEPGPGEVPLWNAVRVVALFEQDADTDGLNRRLAEALGGPPAGWLVERLEDRRWERVWMADFRPMRFGDALWVVPSGCEPPDPGATNLYFDPGLAFGTGTHPTTALCLRWLADNPPVGRTVIDYGCGSGILAVAALRLGAARVIGIDNDPQALVASRENARRNGVEAGLELIDDGASLPEPAPLVLANILSGVIVELAGRIAACVAPGGDLILSGILAHQSGSVAAAFHPDFRFRTVAGEDGWVRLDGRR
ncbi:MAG TPA: 50S ribosomal protein L11 methyltransferase [Gammaproteobacteria bacterium]|nr:50S ribosomal protein L11 methyltransferase [Gammaproteobacteria bacterium]